MYQLTPALTENIPSFSSPQAKAQTHTPSVSLPRPFHIFPLVAPLSALQPSLHLASNWLEQYLQIYDHLDFRLDRLELQVWDLMCKQDMCS